MEQKEKGGDRNGMKYPKRTPKHGQATSFSVCNLVWSVVVDLQKWQATSFSLFGFDFGINRGWIVTKEDRMHRLGTVPFFGRR